MMVISAAQMRAARALLDWTQTELAQKAGVSQATIKRMEGPEGPGRSTAHIVATVTKILEDAGVEFLTAGKDGTGEGVRLVQRG